MKLCSYCLACFRGALPSHLQAPEDIAKVQAPEPQENQVILAVEPVAVESELHSFTEPGQDSSDRPQIIIPESQSLIFTDNSSFKPIKLSKARKRPKKLKKEKTKEVSQGKHEPLPRDAKPRKSILKRR